LSRLVKVKLALVDGDHYIATDYVNDGTHQWERKLLGITENLRAIGLDRTFERCSIKITIDDTNSAYQTMMANDTNRKIANKVVTIYVYKEDRTTLQETIVATIVSWDRDGGKFIVNCEQNFAGKLPQTPNPGILKINATDWPNAPRISLGKKVVYPAGVIYAKRGGMVCWRIDKKPAAKFLITWSDPGFAARVQSIQAVFHGPKVAVSKYTLVRDANGWEYISYPTGRKNLIRVNLTANASLFSAGNPVDSLREGLATLGITLVDTGDVFKTFCTDNGWSIVGAPTDFATVMEYIEFWCQNFDCFWFINPAGEIVIKHLDWSAITSVASLTDRHFESFKETSTMQGFANRIRASLEYNYAKSEWGTEEIVDSTAGDYLPSGVPVEINEEYAIGSFSGAVKPMASKLKYIDHPIQTVVARIKENLYEQLGLSVVDVVTMTHSTEQIGGSGKYLILRESKDTVSGDMVITAHRLWGA